MPIKDENKGLYPAYWKYLSYWIRYFRAQGQCECKGECGKEHNLGRCTRLNKKLGGHAVLTVGHMDHNPMNNTEKNLRAWCEGCHNRYDVPHRRETRRKTYESKKGIISLFKGGVS